MISCMVVLYHILSRDPEEKVLHLTLEVEAYRLVFARTRHYRTFNRTITV